MSLKFDLKERLNLFEKTEDISDKMSLSRYLLKSTPIFMKYGLCLKNKSTKINNDDNVIIKIIPSFYSGKGVFMKNKLFNDPLQYLFFLLISNPSKYL